MKQCIYGWCQAWLILLAVLTPTQLSACTSIKRHRCMFALRANQNLALLQRAASPSRAIRSSTAAAMRPSATTTPATIFFATVRPPPAVQWHLAAAAVAGAMACAAFPAAAASPKCPPERRVSSRRCTPPLHPATAHSCQLAFHRRATKRSWRRWLQSSQRATSCRLQCTQRQWTCRSCRARQRRLPERSAASQQNG